VTNVTLRKPAFFSEHLEQLFECASRPLDILEVVRQDKRPLARWLYRSSAEESRSDQVAEVTAPG